jgi:hypothetical protein
MIRIPPQTNSFRANFTIRNPISTMSNMEIELNGADETAPTEANAADAANNGDTSDEDSLIDFNDEEAVEAAEKAARNKALKEMLTNNGFTLRNLLRSEKVKGHFTSPFSKENEMSLEDILSEIPKEDLHEVGMVQRRIYIPASFVQKWIIPTIRAVTPSMVTALDCQEDMKWQCCFLFSTNRPWIQPSHVNSLTTMLTLFAQ